MTRRKQGMIGILLTLILLMAFMVGCPGNPQQRPAPRPDNQQQQPREQARELREEPTITLFINETGEKKEIKLEEYLVGVVAAEMEPTWPINALAAQAILARTFTMENIQAGRVKELHGTDASTSVEEFQAYDPKRINDAVKKAVDKTRGEIVTYKGDFIKAWFYADAGGKTATAREGLDYTKEPTPYIRVVEDKGITIGPEENKSWTYSVGVNEVRNAVRDKIGRDPGPINSVSIAERGPSGRALKVKLGDTVISGPGLRLALGSDKVRSMLLDSLTLQNGKLVFKGKGFGHGVGMSQWGAHYLAKQGNSPEEIVAYYFKDVKIEKFWK